VSWIAIIIATVANSVLGALWFSPLLFVKPWMKMEGHEQGRVGSIAPGPAVALSVVASLVAAITLEWFVERTGAKSAVGGAVVGLYAGVGLVGAAMFADQLFNGRPGKLYLIVAGYPIVGLVLMGAILGAF